MSDTLESLRHKIGGARDLASVVRTMKSIAASSIGQYERAVASLSDYYRAVELGLSACYRRGPPPAGISRQRNDPKEVSAIVFGSDQGLIGQFNDVLAAFVTASMAQLNGTKTIWTVGERMDSALSNEGLRPTKVFSVPSTVTGIAPLIGEILIAAQADLFRRSVGALYIFHNRPVPEIIYQPASRRLLPLDQVWQQQLRALKWPTACIPQVVGSIEPALVREYLFISLYQACAESLASENATRLAAMQRAENNIAELLEDLNRTFHKLRQGAIDAELFDVISGFEALMGSSRK